MNNYCFHHQSEKILSHGSGIFSLPGAPPWVICNTFFQANFKCGGWGGGLGMKGLGIDRAITTSITLSLCKMDCHVRSCSAIVLVTRNVACDKPNNGIEGE